MTVTKRQAMSALLHGAGASRPTRTASPGVTGVRTARAGEADGAIRPERGGALMAISMDLSQGSYTITGGEQGKRRLNLLAEIFQPTSLRLLKDAGLHAGDRCLDLG